MIVVNSKLPLRFGPSVSGAIHERRNETALRLSGEVDLAAVSPLRQCVAELASQNARPVVVDMSDVAFVDLHGLEAFADADVLRDPPRLLDRMLGLGAATEAWRIERTAAGPS